MGRVTICVGADLRLLELKHTGLSADDERPTHMYRNVAYAKTAAKHAGRGCVQQLFNYDTSINFSA